MTAKTAPAIELRQATSADQPFLQRLYASTRPPSRLRGCDTDAEALLVRVQFLAQQTFWLRQFPDADHTIIVEHQQPIGRLYVHYGEHEIRLLDLTLLPPCRGRGIGKGLLRGLQAHGERMSPWAIRASGCASAAISCSRASMAGTRRWNGSPRKTEVRPPVKKTRPWQGGLKDRGRDRPR
jgi:GNAT superfamily N-acetyltransferase